MDRVVGDAAAARDADDVAARDVGEKLQAGEGDAVAAVERTAGGARADHRGAGQRRKHGVRAGEIELHYAGEQRKDDDRVIDAHRGLAIGCRPIVARIGQRLDKLELSSDRRLSYCGNFPRLFSRLS